MPIYIMKKTFRFFFQVKVGSGSMVLCRIHRIPSSKFSYINPNIKITHKKEQIIDWVKQYRIFGTHLLWSLAKIQQIFLRWLVRTQIILRTHQFKKKGEKNQILGPEICNFTSWKVRKIPILIFHTRNIHFWRNAW